MPSGQNKKLIKSCVDTVAASFVIGVIKAAESEGVAIVKHLDDIGIDIPEINRATHRVDFEIFRELILAIKALSLNDNIGVRIGQNLSLSSFNALGYAASSGDTLLDALQLIPQFESTVMTLGETRIISSDDEIQVCWSMKSGEYFSLVEDIFLASWITLAYLLTDEIELNVEVSFTYAAPSELSSWEKIFGQKLLFSQPVASIKFDRSLLSLALVGTDSFLHQVMTKEAKELAITLDQPLISKIEGWLMTELAKGKLDQKLLSRSLNLSERTLRRRLKEQGTSFKYLLDKVRKGRADYLLRETSMSLWEISSQLGYQQLTSFNAAYKRWTGKTPASQRNNSPSVVGQPPVR